jgi:mannose-6-phosphate isomerase-like protein (cupin superfamily)
MRIYGMGVDKNGRSMTETIDVPMTKVSETESISALQPAVLWRMGFRKNSSAPRTSKKWSAAGGPYEMHVGGPPHILAIMGGYAECTLQDGGCIRMTSGDVIYIRPGALHHSNNTGPVPVIILNLLLPGTRADTQPLGIVKA